MVNYYDTNTLTRIIDRIITVINVNNQYNIILIFHIFNVYNQCNIILIEISKPKMIVHAITLGK